MERIHEMTIFRYNKGITPKGGSLMIEKQCTLTEKKIDRYAIYLREQERAEQTIQKYVRDLNALRKYLAGRPLTKEMLLRWKEELTGVYAPASVNTMLTAVNCFLAFAGCRQLTVRLLKIQRSLFSDEKRELTRGEYARLVQAAEREGNKRLSLIIQTLCATGMRVSELRFITAAALSCGRAEITNKGKRRVVFLPDKLRQTLKKYLQKQKRTAGAVFVTRTGNPLDRSNIWREMKSLCRLAGVAPEKVFPHNLRHLFARTYYAIEKDLSRLADLLGHSNVNTTRIYTAESGRTHARHMERMGLVIT